MSHTQHHLKLYVQTPEIVCGPTALAMLLSAYGRDVTPSTKRSDTPIRVI